MKTEDLSVPTMFNAISSRYDRINHILSLGLDSYWRKTVCRYLPSRQKLKLLDCATGTGDQLATLLRKSPQIYEAIGIDPAQEMLALAAPKIAAYPYKVRLAVGVAEALPFSDFMFDVVTMSFGIRNVADVHQSLKEIYRVLVPQGRILILEFSHPSSPFIRFFHRLYLDRVVPFIGYWMSRNKQAYSYLSKTIESFPQGAAFCEILRQAGFKNIQAKPLSLGAVTLYIGEKPC